MASGAGLLVLVHDLGFPFFSCDFLRLGALAFLFLLSATIPPAGVPILSPVLPGHFDNMAPQWLPGLSPLFLWRLWLYLFVFLFPSLFAPNSQPMS